MKFRMYFVSALVVIVTVLLASCAGTPVSNTEKLGQTAFQKHGRLEVKNLKLVEGSGTPVQLRGFSSYNLAGYDWVVSADYLKELAQVFKIDIIRLAMYTDPRPQFSGYIGNTKLKETVAQIVEDAEAAGLYCIIDWHLLRDGDPTQWQEQSIAFFDDMSKRFASKKHVFYEICNEPNGEGVDWEHKIRPYADAVSATIRKNDPKGIILVGNANYSQDIDLAAKNPLDYNNLMYVFHFYAGSHGDALRSKVTEAMAKVPVFCTEYGVTGDSGDGPLFPKEAAEWWAFMDAHGISSCNWSFAPVTESSAALIAGFDMDGTLIDQLTPSGKMVLEYIQAKH